MNMQPDEIVAEVRAAREEYASRFDFKIEAICRDLMESQVRHRRRLVSFASPSDERPEEKMPTASRPTS